jgi:6-pyruvoyltetrahydropterin/6-carboxytetrahydropterin synthase
MSRAVTVRHNFETAHRLPQIGRDSKCFNLHGHSWNVEITVAADFLSTAGLVVEFGALKKAVRTWIDTHLDHGTMLGTDDPLLPVLRAEGCKVYEFAEWPTVEAVAEELFDMTEILLRDIPRAPDARVLRTVVRETAVNAAMFGSW